ncbi:MAG: glycosyltransferase family 2 protein [Paludibacteraceae bacterium]|nr:glycosyltransferase family 2 protein [Paludibacteraceae bacterium]MBO5988904.1 glycosyltransferase family 2 protein [Paludibacteraceae bacterium]
MNKPLISVIIPNYCHSKYLAQRIESVLNQTYKNFEVIILDDCSPDDGASRSVIEKYRNNPYVSHIVYNEVNSGNTFMQWDKGIQMAKGELCWIAESDDYCELNMLEELVEAYMMQSNTVIAYSTVMFVNDKGEYLSEKRSFPNQYFTSEEYIKRYLLFSNSIKNASCCIFSRQAALNVREDYKNYPSAGDYFFWVYIAEQGNIAVVNRQLSYFRRHDNVVTDKYAADGTNFVVEKNVVDYICNSFHIDKFHKRLSEAYHHRGLRNFKYFDQGTRLKLFDLWNVKPKESFFMRVLLKLSDVLRYRLNYYI